MKDTVPDHSQNKELRPLVRARKRYSRTRKCVGSKAAMIILFWYFAISFAYVLLFLKHTIITNYLSKYSAAYMIIITSGYMAVLQLLFPVAGYLSDTKLGRFKTIQISLGILLLALLCLIIAGALSNYYPSGETLIAAVFYTAWLFYLFGMPGFNVNAIQFGLDQLFYTPADDQGLFIQWYVWVYYLADVIIHIFLDIDKFMPDKIFFGVFTIPFAITTVILLGTVYLSYKKRNWFLIVTRYKNPYALVYKVTRFCFRDNSPSYNSRLNCSTENITSRLDLAKEKYRGPFTTEQVEDVKAFYGVLKVIFSLVPVFFTHVAEIQLSELFATHFQSNIVHSSEVHNDVTKNFENVTAYYKPMIANGTIHSVTAFFIIPFFIFLLQPLVRDYVPGMLKRIGIASFLSLVSVIISLIVDILIHIDNENAGCIFSMQLTDNQTLLSNSTHYNQYPATVLLIIQQIISAMAHVIFYIALYQFICSQSPHSMKGFLLGIFFASRGLSELLAAIFMLPLAMNRYTAHALSCGMVYYIAAIIISVGGIILYIFIAKKYKLREREDAHTAQPSLRSCYFTL